MSSKTQLYNQCSDKFEGAIVLEPIVGVHTDPVACIDFASLYPSEIRAFRLCRSSYVASPVYLNRDVTYYTAEWMKGDARKKHTYAQVPHSETLLPRILTDLIHERKAIRKVQKSSSGVEWAVLEAKQLATKVACNSIHGQMGSLNGKIPAIGIAETVTALVRKLLVQSRDLVVECRDAGDALFGVVQVIYGDTDSLYLKFGGETVAAAFERANKVSHIVTEHLNTSNQLVDRGVIDFEFESLHGCDASMPGSMALYSKKRYAATVLKETPEGWVFEDKLMIKGLAVKRRDSCHYLKDALMGLLKRCMFARSAERAAVARACVTETLEGISGAPLEKLVISKKLAPSYKGPVLAHAQLAERIRARGGSVSVGSRSCRSSLSQGHPRAPARRSAWRTPTLRAPTA
jgi:DNA polymerase delta subunit 1